MSLCIIQLHGFETVEDAEVYAECAIGMLASSHQIVFSVQASQYDFDNLVIKIGASFEFVYVGEQYRTFEEWLIFYTFSNYRADFIYNAISCETVELASRYDSELCHRLRFEFEKCINLLSMNCEAMSQIATANALVASVTSRAGKLSFTLNERLNDFTALIKAESALARGLVCLSVNKIAAAGQLDCGTVNMFESVLEEYRALYKKGRFKEEFIGERINLLLALASSAAVCKNNYALTKYLIVQSAYSFSLAKVYLDSEPNLSGLFAFRSFEFLILSALTKSGEVSPVFSGRMVSYKLNGLSVTGVKDCWDALKSKFKIDESSSKILTSFITVRNRSYLGHGFFHLPREGVELVLTNLIGLVGGLLGDEMKDYWMTYKRCSRSVRIKDSFSANLLNLSL